MKQTANWQTTFWSEMSTAEPLQPFAYILIGALVLFVFFQLGNAFGHHRDRRHEPHEKSFDVPVVHLEHMTLSIERRTQWNLLTAREKQVAALAARGFSNSEIAFRLRIKSRTVDTHIKNIYSKLDVHTRAGLAYEFRRSSR